MTDQEVQLVKDQIMGTVSKVGVPKPLRRAEIKSCETAQSAREPGVDLTETAVEGNERKQLQQLILQYTSVFSSNNEQLGR